MKPFYWVILIVAQIWLSLQICLAPFDAAGVSYRREERVAALRAQDENPSPATRSAMQEELRRAARHVTHRQLATAGGFFAAFLALDIWIYAWKHDKREPAKA
jgi:hypothetical protein